MYGSKQKSVGRTNYSGSAALAEYSDFSKEDRKAQRFAASMDNWLQEAIVDVRMMLYLFFWGEI